MLRPPLRRNSLGGAGCERSSRQLWTRRFAVRIQISLKSHHNGRVVRCSVRYLVEAQSVGKMLQQHDAGGLSGTAAAHTHRECPKLQALGIYIGARAVLRFDIDLPWLPIIPRGPAAVQLYARCEDDLLGLTIASEIRLRALVVIPASFSGDRRWNGRVDQLER